MLLTIEKLVYGGDGLARSEPGPDGRSQAIFVPFVLPEERVEAHMVEQKPGFQRAVLDQVLEPSALRKTPLCPYFEQCGGCHYQHTTYESQLAAKASILAETLQRIAKVELKVPLQIHPSPPLQYRNRTRFQVRREPQFVAGLYRPGSHEVLKVEECPISSPMINRGLSWLQNAGQASFPAGVSEVEFFANAEDSEMLVELAMDETADRWRVRAWVDQMRVDLPRVIGSMAFVKFEEDAQPLAVGASELVYRTDHASLRVAAGAFFQVNRHMVDKLVEVVTHEEKGEAALDLYAGVGLFSSALAGGFRHIWAVEPSPTAHGSLFYNAPSNVKVVRARTEEYLENMPGLRKPELVVVDPPRSGLGKTVVKALAALHPPRLTYVSCDPATLARDLGPLLVAGYQIEQAHLLDMFPQTFHMETVLHLKR